MSHDIFLIVASIASTLLASLIVFIVLRRSGVASALASYKLELNAAGKLEADFTLVNGRVVSIVIDPMVVYDLSNALLNAASRMGAKRHGMIVLDDPDDAKPKTGLKRGAP